MNNTKTKTTSLILALATAEAADGIQAGHGLSITDLVRAELALAPSFEDLRPFMPTPGRSRKVTLNDEQWQRIETLRQEGSTRQAVILRALICRAVVRYQSHSANTGGAPPGG